MEFKAGVGISQADVDGLSGIFTTYFRPAGYTMVERTQIDRVISEQGFQRSALTEKQMVRIGEILNLSMIVIGDINVVAGEYNVDVRVVNVESGVIIATDGESFKGSYRDSMKKLAERLASQVAIKPGQTVQVSPKPKPTTQRTTPFEILGYLKVFPNDIGRFDSEPYTVIGQINSQKQHGYNTWRLPTNEELSLMVANSVVSSSNTYMTSDSRRSGLVRLVTDKGTAQESDAQEQEIAAKKAKIRTIIESDSFNKNNDSYWKKNIISIIATYKFTEFLPFLIKVMNEDSKEEIRTTAAMSIGQLGNASCAKPLYDFVVREKSILAKSIGIQSLAKIGHESVQYYLKELVNNETDPTVREEVINAIEDNLFILRYNKKD